MYRRKRLRIEKRRASAPGGRAANYCELPNSSSRIPRRNKPVSRRCRRIRKLILRLCRALREGDELEAREAFRRALVAGRAS